MFQVLDVITGFSHVKFDRKKLLVFQALLSIIKNQKGSTGKQDSHTSSSSSTTMSNYNQNLMPLPLPWSLPLHKLPLLSSITMVQSPKLYILCHKTKSCPRK